MYGADEIYKDMLATLHKYCKEKKMTIYALAKATGLSTSSVSNLLKGTTKPYVYTLLLICEALSISINDLFAEKTEPLKEEEKIISSYRKMSNKKKKMLVEYIKMLEQYCEDM
mgnify:CR=1 FL=1